MSYFAVVFFSERYNDNKATEQSQRHNNCYPLSAGRKGGERENKMLKRYKYI